MKFIQFVLSILLAVCAIGMLYGAITTYSPMKVMSVSIVCVLCAGCLSFVRIAYKEMVEP